MPFRLLPKLVKMANGASVSLPLDTVATVSLIHHHALLIVKWLCLDFEMYNSSVVLFLSAADLRDNLTCHF